MQSAPRTLFGINSVVPYKRKDGKFFGEVRVATGSTLTIGGETVDLMGGAQSYPWAIEQGTNTAEVALVSGEYPSFLLDLILGKAPVDTAASSTGSVSAITNKLNASVVDATNGIASIAIASSGNADLKFGKYVVEAITTTTVRVYFATGADIKRGTDGEFQDDTLNIVVTDLTITMGGTTAIPNFGLEFTGGSGTIGMTIGDTAEFEVLPPSENSMVVDIGESGITKIEFGLLVVTNPTTDGQIWEFDLLRCVGGNSLPFGMEQKAFGSADIPIKAMYDNQADKVLRARHFKAEC